MNRYQPATSRTIAGLAAAFMTVATLALSVLAPASMDSTTRDVSVASTSNGSEQSTSTQSGSLTTSIDVVASRTTKLDDVTDLQALRQAVKNDKRAYVESTLKLTDAEGKRFWPIYNAYQREVDLNNRRRNVALQELMFRDSAMSNLAAKHYVAELLAVDEAEIKARRTMRNRVMRALPAVKAARYMQLEEKIRAVQDYDAAAAVPLAR